MDTFEDDNSLIRNLGLCCQQIANLCMCNQSVFSVFVLDG